jgi:hypothetical protein
MIIRWDRSAERRVGMAQVVFVVIERPVAFLGADDVAVGDAVGEQAKTLKSPFEISELNRASLATSSGRAYSRSIRSLARRKCARLASSSDVAMEAWSRAHTDGTASTGQIDYMLETTARLSATPGSN